MNFTYLAIALVVSYGLKEALNAMDAFLCVIALGNYERWLI